MAETSDIVIVGAGVLGLCVAVELARRGRDVTVVDPGGRNASSVAAGMIAPAMEATLDGVDAGRARLFRDAAAMWPDFAADAGVEIRPGPGVWRGRDAPAMAARSRALGFASAVHGDAVETSDFQVEPEAAMARMRALAGVTVVEATARALWADHGDWVVETDRGARRATAVVLATGAARAVEGLPEIVAARVAGILPVRGQIGWTSQMLTGRVTRSEGGYVAPMGRGAVIGASMGAGRRDLEPDADEAAALTAEAAALTGTAITAEAIDWRVGIRGATADGLPMAGPSGVVGLQLALAPRRNGWLLAPLVGRVVADGIEGRAAGEHAAALDPLRFG